MAKKVKKNVTVKEAKENAENVKGGKAELEKLMVEEAYAIADGSQPSCQQLMAYAKKHKAICDTEARKDKK